RVESREQRAFALEERRIRHALVLSQETVLIQNALVDLVAELLVLLNGLKLAHGMAAVFTPSGGGADVAAALPFVDSKNFVICRVTPSRHAICSILHFAIVTSSPRSAGGVAPAASRIA